MEFRVILLYTLIQCIIDGVYYFFIGSKMKKTLFSLAALAILSASAHATNYGQHVTSSIANSGGVHNSVKSSATVNGAGSAVSGATSEGFSKANGTAFTKTINCGTCGEVSGTVKITGETETYTRGTAFNVSEGAGAYGNASSTGNAWANVDASAKYTGPGQNVNVYGNSNDTANYSVNADKNAGGFAGAGTDGAFNVTGNVGSKICSGGNACDGKTTTKQVWGSVTDNKVSNSWTNAGSMTVDGKLVNQAPVNATSGQNVTAGGTYYDPQ